MGVILLIGTDEHYRGRRECRLLPLREGRLRRREDARFVGQSREFGNGLQVQFRRNRRAVQLHCPLVDTQIGGDLLVEPAPHDMT